MSSECLHYLKKHFSLQLLEERKRNGSAVVIRSMAAER